MGELLDGWALALPNATWALRTALNAAGVRAGHDVLIASLDWTAGRVAAASLGARPVTVAVAEDSLTIDPRAAEIACTPATRAVIATHPHGVCADVAALRDALPAHVVIVEDAAQALRASLRGHRAGSLGDAAAFSFGPAKLIDAGEMGIVIFRNRRAFERAIRYSQHPVRQQLTGIARPTLDGLAARAAPVSAICAAHGLHQLRENEGSLRAADDEVHRVLTTTVPRARILSQLGGRRGEPGTTAVLLPSDRAQDVVDLEERLESAGPFALRRSSLVPAPAPSGMTSDEARTVTERLYLAVRDTSLESNGRTAAGG